MESVACNLCGSSRGSVVAERTRRVVTPTEHFDFNVRLVCCECCGLVYWSPRKTAGDLRHYYREVYRSPVAPVVADDTRRPQIRARLGLLREFVTPGGRILEIGSGEGFFLQAASQAGFEPFGIEPSKAYADLSASIVPHAPVARGYFEEFDADRPFRVVCAFFVLEHVLDATAFLARCHRLLDDDGWLFLEVPEVERYPGQVSDMVWHEHTYHFTHDTLMGLLAKTGFEATVVRSPGPSYDFGMAVLGRRVPTPRHWSCVPDAAAALRAAKCFAGHESTLRRYRTFLRSSVAGTLSELSEQGKGLAVYGTGVFHDILFEHTDLQPSDVALVIDDNAAKWHTTTSRGLLVNPPTALAQRDLDTVLIASDFFERQMAANVAKLGDEHGRVYRAVCPHAEAFSSLKRADGIPADG